MPELEKIIEKKVNRAIDLWRVSVDLPGRFKDGGRSLEKFQVYFGTE